VVSVAQLRDSKRGISPVIGVILLVVIVVMLVAVSAVTFVSLGESGTEAATLQGVGRFNFDQTGESGNVTINPDSVQSAPNAEFHLRINGYDVYQWNGHDRVELSCLVPGDRLTVVSVTESDQSSVVQQYDFTDATNCPTLSFAERFQYAFVGSGPGDMERVEVGDELAFGLTIDPDGPGPDNQAPWAPNGLPDVGNISLANDWHYMEAYTTGGPIEGLEPPVWVFVLTDNVHWGGTPPTTGDPGDSNYANWTNDTSTFGNPVDKTYTLESGPNGREVQPNSKVYYDDAGNNSDEPTNDIYIVFKPDCPSSTLEIVAQQGGYNNTIYLNGERIVNDTNALGNGDNVDVDPARTFEAPGVCES
jgi:flagellin-like protein